MVRTKCVLLSCVLLLSGCMVIGHNDEFEFDRAASNEVGQFAPDFYIGKTKQNVYAPFFWIYNESPPHDLVMETFDATYHNASKPFETVVIESLQIERAGEAPVELVSSSWPLEDRTHKIPQSSKDKVGEEATVVFKAAITRRDAFVLTMRGYAVNASGERFPFERRQAYQFKERRWVWGLLTA
ncbi:hypothetical protein NA78x_000673 [Anatilimnocola sp. NA78]|uniref:hypothetical protein n=1 Tax=Anatilimnocola sp. NA78 TaxID=3415683 RepID=UPI003CE51CA5